MKTRTRWKIPGENRKDRVSLETARFEARLAAWEQGKQFLPAKLSERLPYKQPRCRAIWVDGELKLVSLVPVEVT